MKQKLIRITSYSSLTSLLGGVLAMTAYAQSAPTIANNDSDLGGDLFCPIINWMFFILLGVAVIMIMWAAYLYVTAGDDTEKVHRATKTITYAAVAIIVALLAKGFPLLIGSVFTSGITTSSPLVCP